MASADGEPENSASGGYFQTHLLPLVKWGIGGNMLLRNAVHSGQAEIVKTLRGSDLDWEQPSGFFEETLLHYAAKNNHAEVVLELLKAGADYNATDTGGRAAIHFAAKEGHTKVLQAMMKFGCNLNLKGSNMYGCTAYHYAAEEGRDLTVKWLLSNRLAELNVHNKFGKPPVMYAASEGQIQVLEVLKQFGCDFNQRANNMFKWTPLHYAADDGKFSAVEWLLSNGADLNLEDSYGKAPVIAASEKGHIKVLEVMKKFGCDFNQRSNNMFKWTPLHYAANNGEFSAVEWLLSNGADMNLEDSYGETPVIAASNNGHIKVLEVMKKFGCDFSKKSNNRKKWTPLQYAADKGKDEAVEWLRRNGEDSASSMRKQNAPSGCAREDEDKSKPSWHGRNVSNCQIPEICYWYVEGSCRYGRNCQRLHAKRHFQWQVLITRNQWHNLSETEEDCIEEAFCDPGQDDIALHTTESSSASLSSIIGEGPWRVDFEKMVLTNSRNQKSLSVRRVCSEKLKGKPVKPSNFLWYFLDINGVWIKYGDADSAYAKHLVSSLTSTEIEQLFNENQKQSIKFQNKKYNYKLDFATMKQTNLETKVVRAVRRRPHPHLDLEPKAFNRATHSELPNHWDPMGHAMWKRVSLPETSDEYKKVCDSIKTAIDPQKVEEVERIQNPFVWFAYQNKVKEMSAIYGSMEKVNVCQLFHGTSASVVDKICEENFDWRLHGTTTGQLYGQGTYFSPNAKTAYNYCKRDSSGRLYFFVATVAVGTYTVGNKTMVRPPTNPVTGKLYDSTVDNELNSNIIVKYDKQEYYPEYIVTIDPNKPITSSESTCIIS